MSCEPVVVRDVAQPPDHLRGVYRESWIKAHGTPWQRCLRDILSDKVWGVSRRSQFLVAAPLHIVVEGRMWCTGGPAIEGEVHPVQKRCRHCMALAREQADEYYADWTCDGREDRER